MKELRLARRLTQEQLGERAGLSYKFVGEVERGSGNPTLDTLSKLAEALHVEVMDLVNHETASAGMGRLSASDYASVREARDSLEALLKRGTPKRAKRR